MLLGTRVQDRDRISSLFSSLELSSILGASSVVLIKLPQERDASMLLNELVHLFCSLRPLVSDLQHG